MRRYDLRHLADNFEQRMNELCEELPCGEVAIFLFEVRKFDNVQKAIDCILNRGDELLNSLRFNEVDWSIVVRRSKQ
ncbi:NADH-ubiquinone oxidoreductase subunit E family protein [Helicobacter sp. MIT 21-1697]|uniref:NADH-ubiquinone oxidoreductase subunit E family protein n=1 Tax=Helicobacter sp. MIT 21-1697 TaxID=2993733 RepID=UPI00224B64F8|nr:NADH-ubiquinone oxidoreductase subunit E family protein [Helicobacter sp. MIT 21-1697]MCX2717285.1 NADH-ubiquinone oxidoreductase subunit E family protein [Helicobacter sp. MIT 21-1697]